MMLPIRKCLIFQLFQETRQNLTALSLIAFGCLKVLINNVINNIFDNLFNIELNYSAVILFLMTIISPHLKSI